MKSIKYCKWTLCLLVSVATGWGSVYAKSPSQQALKVVAGMGSGKLIRRVVSENGAKASLAMEIDFEITRYSGKSFFVFGVSHKDDPKNSGAPQVGFRRGEEGKLQVCYRAAGTEGFQTLPTGELRSGGSYLLKLNYAPAAGRAATWSFTLTEKGKGVVAEAANLPFNGKNNRLDSIFLTTWAGGSSLVTVIGIKAEVDGGAAFSTDFAAPDYKPNESIAGQQGWLPGESTSNFEIIPF